MLWRSLTARDCRPERMDDPHLDPAEHRRALAGLARINRFSGSARVLWPCVVELAAQVAPHPLRILDVATGSGDVVRALDRLARKRGVRLELAGCDISPVAIAAAKTEAAGDGAAIEFFTHDALRDPLPNRFDLVMCSLFLHHLQHEHQLALLIEMARAAQRGILVNDLLRSRFNYLAVWGTSRLLSRSPVVHEDGPLSVRAALNLREVGELAQQAGLADARIRASFPCRFLLDWRKPA
jgi:SAM-dependent methyltransferase